MEDLQPNESMDNNQMKVPPTVLPTSQPEESVKHGRSPTMVGLPRDVSFAGLYHSARPIQLGKRGNRSWRRDGLTRRSNEQGLVQRSESPDMSSYSRTSSAQQEQVHREQAGTSQDKMSSVSPRKPALPKRSSSTVQIPSSQSISSPSVTPDLEKPKIDIPSPRISPRPQRDGSPQILPPGSAPPLKRRKLDHPSGSARAQDSSQLTSVKDEGGITSSAPTRRLVTESCQFYPLPDNCKRSHPDYKQNRQAFFRHEYAKLLNLGLKKKKVIMRDDGMVIEWISSIPVWSDTLQPMNLATAIAQTLQNNANAPPHRSRTRTPSSSSARSDSVSLPAAPPLQAKSLTRKPHSAPVPSVRRFSPARPSSVKTESEQRAFLFSSSQSLSSVSPFPSSSQTSVTSVAPVGGEAEPLFSTLSESPFSAIKIESTDLRIKSEDTIQSQTPFPASQSQYQSSNPQKIPLPRRRRLPIPKSVTIPAPKEGPIQIKTEDKKEPDTLTSPQPISAPSESLLVHSNPDPPPSARCSPADLHPEPEPEFTRNFESDMVDSQVAPGSLAVSANSKQGPSIPTLQSSSPSSHPGPSNPPPLRLDSQSGQSTSQHGQLSSVEQASPAVTPSSPLPVSECAVQDAKTVEPPAPNISLTSGPASVVKSRAWSAEELSEVKPMALDFLRRYIQAFDADRTSLRDAYAKESTFSYRIHTSSTESSGTSSTTRFKPSVAHSFVPQSSSAATKTVFQGPEQIVKAITGFGPFKFCPRNSPSKVHYDVASLHDAAGGGILLMAYGEVVREKVTKVFFQKEDVLSVDFSFVLHRKEDSSSCWDESTWPLVSVAHQMTVRDMDLGENTILLPSDFEKQFPWLSDTN